MFLRLNPSGFKKYPDNYNKAAMRQEIDDSIPVCGGKKKCLYIRLTLKTRGMRQRLLLVRQTLVK